MNKSFKKIKGLLLASMLRLGGRVGRPSRCYLLQDRQEVMGAQNRMVAVEMMTWSGLVLS